MFSIENENCPLYYNEIPECIRNASFIELSSVAPFGTGCMI